jgi:hypothetical protein
MATVLDRIQHLLALASSPNEHEARNAALLAAQLIKKHGVQLTMPATRGSSGKHAAARPPEPGPPPSRRKTPGSKRVKRVADPAERIVSPLGGECVHCGSRYKPRETVYWFASGGGMHVRCFDEWAKKHDRK